MNNWGDYDKQTIWADKKRGGLLVSFLTDYREMFNQQVNASCKKCFENYYNNYLNSTGQMEIKKNECDYELLAKYNGMQIGHGGRPIRNGEMTNKIAKELLEWHPLGEGLFKVTPLKTRHAEELAASQAAFAEKFNRELAEKHAETHGIKSDEELTLTELREKHPDFKSNSKAGFLAKLQEPVKAEEEERIAAEAKSDDE
jgi:hypothetical protein